MKGALVAAILASLLLGKPIASPAAAGPAMTAYLFIAVKELNGRHYYSLAPGQSRLEQLEEMFLERHQALGLELKVVKEASQNDLAQALTNPTTAAIYWVGHSSGNISGVGWSAGDVIMDANGNNVAPLFQKLHPNIRWLSIVGCSAQQTLDKYKKLGFYRQNPLLKIHSHDGVIEPSIGLNQATAAGYLFLSSIQKRYPEIFYEKDLQSPISFVITRSLQSGQVGGSLQVLVNERFTGIIPRTFNGETVQELKLLVDKKDATHLDIEVISSNLETEKIGEISVTDPDGKITHQMLHRKNGEPMGKNRRLLIFKGNE